MKRQAAVMAALLALPAAAAAGPGGLFAPSLPAMTAHAAYDPASVAAGARVAALGDCMVCHTAQGGRPFAGGRAIRTPFGVVYSTNITPDADTGIGRWSPEAFARALRRGISRDGHLLYPAFPYPHFTRMTDDDIGAVYAFLMTREPVAATAPANRLMFPLNFRPLIAGWNLLFLDHQAPVTQPARDAQWARGRYLVEGLGHCGACHTPMNRLGAEEHNRAFSGGQADGWDAPALNDKSPAPRRWTQPQLVAFLRTGLATDHGAAAGPMRPVTQALAAAPAADIEAMAAYLVSLRDGSATAAAPATAQASEAGLAVDDAPVQRGAVLFAGACAVCHDASAPMTRTGGRPPLALSSMLSAASPRNAIDVVLLGIPATHADTLPTAFETVRGRPPGASGMPTPVAGSMPGFASTFSDRQVADLAAYLRTRVAGRPAWPDLEAAATRIRQENNPP